jgi:hypothetical protein
MKTIQPKRPIETLILSLRGQKVILDADLAELYGVATKVFNQAVKRNAERFPEDFCLLLTLEEAAEVRRSRSQFVTMKRGQNVKYRPHAFTEHGAIMADGFEQPGGGGDERVCGAGVHAAAGATGGECGDPQAAGGN